MADIIPAATLSMSGWVRAPAEKADALLSDCFVADKSQTTVYGDNVTSIQWLIQRYGSAPSEAAVQIRTALERYLGRYYPDGLSVEVRHDDTPANLTGIITLVIDVVFTEGSSRYSLGRELQTRDSKILKIAKINNG